MTTRRRIVTSAVYNFLSSCVSYPTTVVAGIIISRTLGPQNYGIWALCLVYGNLSLRIATAGLLPGCNTYMMKVFSTGEVDKKKLFTNVLVLELVLVIVGSLLSVSLVGFFYGGDYLLSALRIAVVYNLIVSLNSMFNYIYQANEVMKYRLVTTALSLSANLIILITWATYFHGVRSLLVTGIFLYSVIFLFQFKFIMGKFSLWSWDQIDIRYWVNIVKKSFFFAINSQLLPLYISFDIVMLSWLSSTKQIGYYNISYTYLSIAAAIPAAVGWAIFPALSRIQNGTSASDVKLSYFPLEKVYLTLGIFITLAYFLFSDYFIPLLYGSSYVPSILILKVLSLTVFISFVSALFSQYLATGNQERYTAMALGASVIVNVLLNLILIPKYEGVGAAIATVLAEIFLCAVYIKLFYSKILQFEWNYATPILRGFVLMVLIGAAVQVLNFSLIFRIIFLVVSYPMVIWLAGVYPADAIDALRKFIQEIKKKPPIEEEMLA